MRVDNTPQNSRRIRADGVRFEHHQSLQFFLAFLVPERDRQSRATQPVDRGAVDKPVGPGGA